MSIVSGYLDRVYLFGCVFGQKLLGHQNVATFDRGKNGNVAIRVLDEASLGRRVLEDFF